MRVPFSGCHEYRRNRIGSFLSSVAFGYMVESFGSYDRALLPLAFYARD